MIYSLKRIIHNLKRHLLVYLLFVVQFAVGILILCSALNVLVTMQKNLKATQEEMASSGAIEIISDVRGSSKWTPPTNMRQTSGVSYDVYLKLKELYKEDFTFQYGLDMNWNTVWAFDAEDKSYIDMTPTINVWFVNDELFEDYFGIPMEQDKMYAGENAKKVLLQIKEWSDNPNKYLVDPVVTNVIDVENGEFRVAKKDIFTLVDMPPSEKEKIEPSIPWYLLSHDGEIVEENGEACEPHAEVEGEDYVIITLSDCVFLPIAELPEFEDYHDSLDWEGELKDWGMESYDNLLKAEYKDSDFKTETISEMLSYLMRESHATETGATVEFTVDEKMLEMQKQAEMVKASMRNYMIMSVSILVVVMLGTTGLFLIFLYRRKKQMAVSIAFGSTKNRLFKELFAEIFLITGSGAGLGLSALRFTTEYFKTFYSEMVFQSSCIGIAFAIAAVTALFTAILAFTGVGEIAPAKILKEL